MTTAGGARNQEPGIIQNPETRAQQAIQAKHTHQYHIIYLIGLFWVAGGCLVVGVGGFW